MASIYDRTDWPAFRWDDAVLSIQLAAVRHRQGRLLGRMSALGFPLRTDAVFRTLVQDVLATSEIEGEHLDPTQVRSSLAGRLGIDTAGFVPVDRRTDGIVTVLLDATQAFAAPLTERRLLAWHEALFPTGGFGRHPITVGAWRDDALGPMRVVSGAIGRERIHFQAPLRRASRRRCRLSSPGSRIPPSASIRC